MTDETNADGLNLIRRIDQVEAKVDRLGLSMEHMAEQSKAGIEHIAKELRAAIEAVTGRYEDHIRLLEQRMDMGVREHQQSIQLLTSTVQKHEQEQSGAETQLQMLGTELVVLKKDMTEVTGDVAGISDALRWISRAVVGMLISGVGSLVVAAILYVATH